MKDEESKSYNSIVGSYHLLRHMYSLLRWSVFVVEMG